MKNLSEFIGEQLKIKKDTNVYKNDIDLDSLPINVIKNQRTGECFQWFKWWKHLRENGPMSKVQLLSDFNLVTTSYATMFADLNKRRIIVTGPKKGLLMANDPDKWVVRK